MLEMNSLSYKGLSQSVLFLEYNTDKSLLNLLDSLHTLTLVEARTLIAVRQRHLHYHLFKFSSVYAAKSHIQKRLLNETAFFLGAQQHVKNDIILLQ